MRKSASGEGEFRDPLGDTPVKKVDATTFGSVGGKMKVARPPTTNTTTSVKPKVLFCLTIHSATHFKRIDLTLFCKQEAKLSLG